MKKIYLPFIIYWLLLSCTATGQPINNNQDLTEKQWLIMHQVISADGTINEDIHTEFWKEVPQYIKDEWNKNLSLKLWLTKHVKLLQEYQRAFWDSALLSYQNNRVIKSEALVRLENTIKDDATNQFNAIPMTSTTRLKLQTSFSHADQILLAAANHSYLFIDEKEILINEKLITQILEGLNKSMERFNILLDPLYYSKKNTNTPIANEPAITNNISYQQSFVSCSFVAVQTLENVSDYLSGVPLEKILAIGKGSKTVRNNAPLVYKLIKEKGLKSTLFSIHLALVECIKIIPDYNNKQNTDPYGLCAWNEANDLLILLNLDSGKTTDEIKKMTPNFLHEKVDALSKMIKKKNIESVLIEVSNIFKECVIKTYQNEKHKTNGTYY